MLRSRLDLPTSGVLVAAVGDEQSAAAKWLQAGLLTATFVFGPHACRCNRPSTPVGALAACSIIFSDC